MKKKTIIIIVAAVVILGALIFFILGFLRKGPGPGGANGPQGGPGMGGPGPTQQQASIVENVTLY